MAFHGPLCRDSLMIYYSFEDRREDGRGGGRIGLDVNFVIRTATAKAAGPSDIDKEEKYMSEQDSLVF